MQHLDEGTIHAWLDGALAPNEASAAEAHVQTCAPCANAVAEARGLIAASSRILAALDDVPAVQQAHTIPLAARRRNSWFRRAGVGYAAAATALLAVGTTIILQQMSADQAFQAAAPVVSETRAVQPDASVPDSSVRPPRVAASTNEAAGAGADARRLSASARSKNVAGKEPAKEELAVDRIVPLPGPMPRPAAPTPPPVRQESERKALADAALNVAPFVRGPLVQGRVIDGTTGAPVAGATVSIDSARVRTDSEGKFKLQPAPLGQQTVNVRALGFQSAQHQVAVEARDSVDLGFTLQKVSAPLEQAVTTGAAAARESQLRARTSGLRDSLQRAQQAAPPVLRLEDIRANTANILGCYTLRATSDKARDADRNPVFAMPTQVELEGRAQERARREEPIVNRARKLAGSGTAESWRFVGDSLELTVVDGTRRRVLRFARENSRWVSQEFVLERCESRP